MYCNKFIIQSLRHAGITPLLSRKLRILSSRPLLIKSDQTKVYRLKAGGLERLPGDRGPGRSGDSPSLLSRIHLALTGILNNNTSIRMPLIPPKTTRGMDVLDRNAFTTLVDIPSVRVPIKQVGNFQKKVRKHLFRMQRIKPVAELSDDDPDREQYRLFLFDPDKFKTKNAFYEVAKEVIDEFGIDLSTWQVVQIELNYSNWHYDEILRAVIPPGLLGVGGFSIIGHILHINLKDELLPYKRIIGEVLLDKVASVQTVVNKTNTIDATFRNFSFEVLAGKEEFITTAKENGNSFKMDFCKVYWNPRLSTEHQRVVDQLQPGDVLYDVFAGVGPFSVPAARNSCFVVANDLNPQAYKWLKVNLAENKAQTEPQLYNLDGREFIRTVLKEDLLRRWSDQHFSASIHIVMNLPGLALSFLDTFIGLLPALPGSAHLVMPTVHCYAFSKAPDPVEDVRARAQQVLGSALPADHVVRVVRNVAPNKEMLCAQFQLQKDVLFAQSVQPHSEENLLQEPAPKKSKMDSSQHSLQQQSPME